MSTTLISRRFWSMFLFAVVCSANSAGAAADPPDVTFRSEVNEVRLRFSVTDQNQHGVATLQAGDFAVVDKERVIRNFQSFSRFDATKLQIAIVVDASGSVAPHFQRETAELVELISQTAGVPDENLSLFSFHGAKPAMICAGNCRTTHAAEFFPIPRNSDLTPLFDTLVFATNFLAEHSDRDTPKVLVVFSDGQDSISRNSFTDAQDAAMKSGVQIYGIDVTRGSTQGAAILCTLASSTGGRYFSGHDAATRALNVILEDFKASYIITYKLPANAAGFHSLRILPTRNSQLEFRSRSGYYYPDSLGN